MIERLDQYVARMGRLRRVRRVDLRVVNESERGWDGRSSGALPRRGFVLNLDRDPGRLVTCPRCGAISRRPCEGGERHPERDAMARELVERAERWEP